MVPSTEGGTMTTKTPTQYQHLEPRPGSSYRQLFLKGRRIRAAVVDEAIHGPDPRTPEEFARDYQVPLEAGLEALDYVAQNRPLIELLPRQESFASLHILTRRASEGSEALPSLARRVRMSFFGARVIAERSYHDKIPRESDDWNQASYGVEVIE